MNIRNACLAFAAWSLSGIAFAAADSKPILPSLDLLRDPEVVELFRSIPAQDSGRVKPLDKVARVRLLRYFGHESIALTNTGSTSAGIGQPEPEPLTDPATGKKIVDARGGPITVSGMEWMLISWFRPDVAKQIPVFVVDNSDAVTEIGITEKSKRDHYSYTEILPGRKLLMEKMQEIQKVEAKSRSAVERSVGKLAMDFLDDEMLLDHFDFARAPFGDETESLPKEILDPTPGGKPGIAGLLTRLAAYFKDHPEFRNNPEGAALANPWFRGFFRTLLAAQMSGNDEQMLRIFPPADLKKEEWYNPGKIMEAASLQGQPDDDAIGMLAAWEGVYQASGDPALFKSKVKSLHDELTKRALAHGQGQRIAMEVSFDKADYFFWAKLLFIAGLIFLALSWVSVHSVWGRCCLGVSWLTMLSGLACATTGIVIRCIIMQRPPITVLYETIIFITTAAVIIGLLAELLTRKGIGILVAAIAGVAGMYLSALYMESEGTDTMQQLEAVLITNFWLSTHVPCINLGYAAGMVAAILSMIYLVQRLFTTVKAGDEMAKSLTRIGYGFVMAGLFLSLVGTVLGGIWANYSWGRFWGWDPKENGALMIVLMNLVILHARLGHYIREVGFHCCCIVLGMIVVFSWFGVNNMGVGLHAYGFTAGMWHNLKIFWSFQLALLAYGIFLSFHDRSQRRRAKLASEGSPGAHEPPMLRPVNQPAR